MDLGKDEKINETSRFLGEQLHPKQYQTLFLFVIGGITMSEIAIGKQLGLINGRRVIVGC